MKNNKGFSLVELIIVIAILSVLTGASVVGLGYLYSTNVKSSVKKLDSDLQKVQSYTVSKSTENKKIGLVLKKTGSGWYVQYKGIPNMSDDEIGKKNLKVYYMDDSGSGWQQVTSGLTVYFDRATGGLLELVDASDADTGKYLKKIRLTIADDITDDSKCCTIEISKVTGKTTVKVYQ